MMVIYPSSSISQPSIYWLKFNSSNKDKMHLAGPDFTTFSDTVSVEPEESH